MHGKARTRMCNPIGQWRISLIQLTEYPASTSYIPRQRSPSSSGARHTLPVRLRSGATIEVSSNPFTSTDLCRALLESGFCVDGSSGRPDVVSKRLSYMLLSLCSVFSESKALGEDESGSLVWKSVLGRILAKRDCGE